MPERMRYYSTNGQVPDVGLAAALLQGQADDRGLFLPRSYPHISSRDV